MTPADPRPGGAGAAPDEVAPLEVVPVPGATVYPPHETDDPSRHGLGVVDAGGTLLERTTDDRHHGSQLYVPPRTGELGPADEGPSEAIYAGTYQRAFGHFLLESLQRLWWAGERPDLPIVWVAQHDRPLPELTGWQREMLDVVGVTNETLVVNRPTRFDLLHVPDAGYKYADWYHPQHIAFLAAHEGPAQVPGHRLWLSRGRAWGGVTNRHIIERKLEARGWEIVTFDTMPLREQLDSLARATVIAGEEGSTFHNLLLLRDVSRKRFHVFRRHGREHQSFRTIGDAREVNQVFHGCNEDAVVSVTGRRVARLAPNPSQYLSRLHVKVAPPAPLPDGWLPGPTISLANRLAERLGARTYLQLGPRHRSSVTEIHVPSRDYVQEEFRFDVRGYRDLGASFYEVTVEEFLAHFRGDRTYDLVVAAHDPDWRRAVGRVRAVLDEAAHDRTVLVLDHGGAAEQPASARLLAALHDLHPDLDHRTVTTDGAAHTVVRRRSRSVTPLVGGEAEIEAASPETLAAQPELFAHTTEDALLAELAGEPPPGRGGLLGRVLRRG